MTAYTQYLADLFFLLLGLSVIIDVVILAGSARVMRLRKVRILSALFLISLIVLVYLVYTILAGFSLIASFPAYAGILLAFSVLSVFYFMILKGMS
ncbi:MAG: hypothetical protein M1267_05235 [Candidatus Thermoplasmatota archaeon]|jgi:hypothetical protein|nr:hypothetical protein [Candidatus Thermoplasmatota archaeon]MCL5799768.1 hypothetical protein [Candidatus Thermoplasmatota archaeon]